MVTCKLWLPPNYGQEISVPTIFPINTMVKGPVNSGQPVYYRLQSLFSVPSPQIYLYNPINRPFFDLLDKLLAWSRTSSASKSGITNCENSFIRVFNSLLVLEVWKPA